MKQERRGSHAGSAFAGPCKWLKRNEKAVIPLLLGLILVYACVYEIVFAIGPSYFGDDLTYTFFAYQIVHGLFVQGAPFSYRLLNIFPIAFFYELFGVGVLTTGAWSILCFLGTIVVTFLIGRELHSDRAGLLAALLISFFPLFVALSSTDSPNIVGGFFAGLVMLALIRAVKRRSRREYFLAGVFMVAAALATPQTVGIVVIAVLYLAIELLRKKARLERVSAYLVYGLLLSGVVLMVYNYSNTRNPFETITGTVNTYSTASAENYNMDLGYYFGIMFPFHVLTNLWHNLIPGPLNPTTVLQTIYWPQNNFVGYFFYAAVAAGVYLAWKRDRRAYVPLLWILVGFLCLEFGWVYIKLIPFQYILTGRLERYLTIIGIPVVLLISFALLRFIEDARSRPGRFLKIAFAAGIVLILIATSVPISQFWYVKTQYQTYGQRQIAAYLSLAPNTTKIYIDTAFNNILIYMGYSNPNRFNVYDGIANCSYIPDSVYVVMPVNASFSGLDYTQNPDAYCPGWKLVMNRQEPGNYPEYITGAGQPFLAKLYYVFSNRSA